MNTHSHDADSSKPRCSPAPAAWWPRGWRSRMRPPMRASCSCCCAARSMDLSAVPPVGDPDYAALRGQIALAKSGEDAALPLDGPFGLHPALKFLHASYAAKELAVLHAVASPYRERSHFDAQNVLESGGVRPHGTNSGWINRALAALPAARRARRASRSAPTCRWRCAGRPRWPRGRRRRSPRWTRRRWRASRISTRATRCCRGGSPRRWRVMPSPTKRRRRPMPRPRTPRWP